MRLPPFGPQVAVYRCANTNASQRLLGYVLRPLLSVVAQNIGAIFDFHGKDLYLLVAAEEINFHGDHGNRVRSSKYGLDKQWRASTLEK